MPAGRFSPGDLKRVQLRKSSPSSDGKRLPNNESGTLQSIKARLRSSCMSFCIKKLANDGGAHSGFFFTSHNFKSKTFSSVSFPLSALLHRQGIAFLNPFVCLEFAVFNTSSPLFFSAPLLIVLSFRGLAFLPSLSLASFLMALFFSSFLFGYFFILEIIHFDLVEGLTFE